MAKIYVSSTSEDLKQCRNEVISTLRRMKHEAIVMEDYTATDGYPLDECLEDVATCDVYIGLFAWRYGYIPNDVVKNPKKKSITELEFLKARDNGIPCFIFLLDEKAPWPFIYVDQESSNIRTLRKDFCNKKIVDYFNDKNTLATKVSTTIAKWQSSLEKSQAQHPGSRLEESLNSVKSGDNSKAKQHFRNEFLNPSATNNVLVIRTRRDTLKKNLTHVHEAVILVQKMWQDVGDLDTNLSESESALLELKTKVISSIGALNGVISKKPSEQTEDSRREIEKALEHIEKARDVLKEVVIMVENILEFRVVPAREIIDPINKRAVGSKEDKFVKGLLKDVSGRIDYCKEELIGPKIDSKITKATNTADRAKQIQQAWRGYSDIYNETQEYIGECVDFLAGVALRDTGFDRQVDPKRVDLMGVGQMADELITQGNLFLGDQIKSTLAIPSLRIAVKDPRTKRIFRFGCPEWTLWALPLIAHLYGRLLVEEGKVIPKAEEIDETLKNKGKEKKKKHVEVCLADAFATYMMGPAYACAALLLRFDLPLLPEEAYKSTEDKSGEQSTQDKSDEQPAAYIRAQVVFSMLERIDSEWPDSKKLPKPYAKIIKTLKEEWEAALQQTEQPSAPDQLSDDLINRCVFLVKSWLGDKLYPPTKALTNKWVERFLPDEWSNKIEVDATDELREVLVAAWVCRINNTILIDDNEERIKTISDIRLAAYALWEQIQEKRK